jgi:sialic acid synthase SpsE
MLWLKKTGFNVGFSDHTRTYRDNYKPYSDRNLPSLVAINMGAKLLERHFTNLPPNVTKDGKISISKTDLQKLVKFSKKTKTEQKILLQKNQKKIELIMGGDNFEPSTEEFWNRSYYKGRVKTTTKNKSNNF